MRSNEELEHYKGEIREILNSINITSDTSYIFKDQSYDINPDQIRPESATEDKINNSILVTHLQQILYETLHCRSINNSLENDISPLHYYSSQDFIGALSEANTGHGTWEPGWQIQNVTSDGQLTVQKDGLMLWVYPEQFISQDSIIEIGRKGRIRMVKEFRQLMPGFYMAIGDTPEDENVDETIVRLYWNIKSSYSIILMKHLTCELNNAAVPFRFKILNNQYNFPRADAAVLYINKKYFYRSKQAILQIYEKVKTFLEPLTPLFSKGLRPGLALAEDPNNNESFGQHRCRIFAEAILSVHQKKVIDSLDAKTLEVYAYFKNLGLDLDRPYLNHDNTEDGYDFSYSRSANQDPI